MHNEIAPATAAHPMDSITVRRLRFDVADVPADAVVWSRTSPEFAMFLNALGVHVPYFERFLVAVLREVRGEIADPRLARDVQAIIGQEAHHAFNFEAWNQRLVQRYPAVAALDNGARAYFVQALATRGHKFKVGFVAGYETFTFLGGMFILNRYDELMADADPTLRAMWVWHQVEEVEHGAVAFDVYKAFYAECEWYRRWMVVHAFAHIAGETIRAYARMLRVEDTARSPLRRLRAWRFFGGFVIDLLRGALPVFGRRYHPRQHPMCNQRQNRIAVAWRAWHAAGGETTALSERTMSDMLHRFGARGVQTTHAGSGAAR